MMMPMNKLVAATAALVGVLLTGTVGAAPAGDDLVARGEYLARAGNCAGCHTARGGADYAGGRAIGSGYGTFFAPNITPDPVTGIGSWSEQQFWEALHHGRRADGSPLYPVCPYPNYTQVRRDDVNAIYAYLRTVPAVEQERREHDLRFPVSVRALVSAWQLLYFEPGVFQPVVDHGELWNRGAYLVEGLGHCAACHVERNVFGAARDPVAAPGDHVQGWYAPSLYASAEAGLQGWSVEEGAALLRHGRSGEAATMGPMADVVFNSLQHLSETDVQAMVTYLRELPDTWVEGPRANVQVGPGRLESVMYRGQQIYERSCRDCHGDMGEGTVAASALAGNRAVLLNDPSNVIHVIRSGGYPPSTEGNPRPFGMPPFAELSAADIAAVATYIRNSWGNDADPVSAATVQRTERAR